MAKNIQLNRYVGSNTWEKLFPTTTIDNVYLNADASTKFLNNGKIRANNLSIAGTEEYQNVTENNKNNLITNETLKNVYSGLTNQIAGKKSTYVSTAVTDFRIWEGDAVEPSTATESSLSGDNVIVFSISTTDGITLGAENVKIGDVILRSQVDVTDWWVGDISIPETSDASKPYAAKFTLYPLETRKMDLSGYVKTSTLNNYYTRTEIDKKISDTTTLVRENKQEIDAINEELEKKVYKTDIETFLDKTVLLSDEVGGKIGDADDKGIPTELGVWTIVDNYMTVHGIEEGANKTVVDSTLSSTSTNPVQNKVIKSQFDTLTVKIQDIKEHDIVDINNRLQGLFRSPLSSDYPTENLTVGDLCITLVS